MKLHMNFPLFRAGSSRASCTGLHTLCIYAKSSFLACTVAFEVLCLVLQCVCFSTVSVEVDLVVP